MLIENLRRVAAIVVDNSAARDLWAVRLWRGHGSPFLVPSEDGMQSLGFCGTLRWVDVQEIAVVSVPAEIAVVLLPGVVLPARTVRIRRLSIDAATQEVVLLAPGGANPLRRVAERLASALEWRVDAQGSILLAALDRNGSDLLPTCLRWNGDAPMPTPCPQ